MTWLDVKAAVAKLFWGELPPPVKASDAWPPPVEIAPKIRPHAWQAAPCQLTEVVIVRRPRPSSKAKPGYSRIDGYERFDGRAAPSAAKPNDQEAVMAKGKGKGAKGAGGKGKGGK